ncbi:MULTISPECIES: hypothetical protein [Leisingera]|uniref:hypothetical protein n=1 Tax=Leisingera TaxID=191028 RepID=UPI000407ECED|nr:MULTISPECIES: hypothetical protein [Leisingera]
MTKPKTGGHPDLTMVNPCAAAIDIGSTMHMAAVNPDADAMPVRAFGTFTRDLHNLAAWFRSSGVTSVAMESTGVYRIPAFEILEAHGFEITRHGPARGAMIRCAGICLKWSRFSGQVSG